jgi:threonine dehydratase
LRDISTISTLHAKGLTLKSYAADLSSVSEAASRIAAFAHRTPVMTCRTLDRLAKRELFFKCENFQKVGAFKFRGACNAIAKLSDRQASNGVLTHSSGNHAQAVALAARIRGVKAYVVMPSSSSQVKRQAVKEYGAEVITCEPELESRETTAAKAQEETGATFIAPYNDPDVISGQGTAALELLEDVAALDVIVAPVGGGGLISGICATVLGKSPSTKVVAAEPIGADDAARSKLSSSFIPQMNPQTIADGLLTSLGDLTWPFVRDVVDRVITVSEEEIVTAMRLLWQRAKLLVEPSAAVALAAVLNPAFQESGNFVRVGVVLSGGNVDIDNLPW